MKKITELLKNKKIRIAVIAAAAILIGVCIAVICVNSSESEEGRVLLSCDFNESEEGFFTTAWTADVTEFSRLSDGGIDGSGCLCVKSDIANDARYAIELDVQPKKNYEVTGWIKTENIPQDGGAKGANISVDGSFADFPFIYGDSDWQQVKFYGRTALAQKKITLNLRLGFYSGDNTGTAFFDNIQVRQVSSIPEGYQCLNFENSLANNNQSNTQSSDDDKFPDAKTYSDLTIALNIGIIFVALAFFVAYKYARGYDGLGYFSKVKPFSAPAGGRITLKNGIIAILIAGVLIRLILSLSPLECGVDVNLFKHWGTKSFEGGFSNTYNTLGDSIDYPPVVVYFLWIAAAVRKLFENSDFAGSIFSMMVKMPAMLSDVAIMFFILKIADKKMSNEWKTLLCALWFLNPVVILDSAVWGQVDSFLALFVLLGVYFAENEKYLYSGIALGLGLMLKPQAIICFPIIFFILFKKIIKAIKSKKTSKPYLIGTAKTIGGFLIGAIAPCLPFVFRMQSVEVEVFGKMKTLPWILSLFVGTANHYSYASVNALNFWYSIGKNWVADSENFGIFTYFTWGMIAIVIVCLAVWALHYFSKNEDKFMPYYLAGVLYLGVSTFSVRMHERYFFTAIIFFAVALAVSNNKIMLYIQSLLSISGFLVVAEVLLDLEVGQALKDHQADISEYGHYLWVYETDYRNALAVITVALTLIAFAIGAAFVIKRKYLTDDKMTLWKLHEPKPETKTEIFDDADDSKGDGDKAVLQNQTAEQTVDETDDNKNTPSPFSARKWLKRVLLSFGVIAVLFCFCSCGLNISNNDFERKGTSKKLPGWTKYNYESEYSNNYDCTQFEIIDGGYEGKSLKISSADRNDARVYQKVSVKEQTVYKLSVMIKTENVSGGAGANISAYDCQGTSSGIFGTSDWQEHTVYLTTQKGQTSMQLSLGLGGFGSTSSGVAYFDNFTIAETDAIPDGAEQVTFMMKNSSDEGGNSVSLGFKLLFITVIVFLIAYSLSLALKSDSNKFKKGKPLSETLPKRNKNDVIIAVVLTVICAAFSFANLGSTSCASNYWQAAEDGESVTAEFEGEHTVTHIVFSGGIPSSQGQYKIYYEDAYGEWQEGYIIGYDAIEFYKWNTSENLNMFTTSKIRVVATSAGVWVNEIGFFETDSAGEMKLIKINQSSISADYKETKVSGKAENLFDEQDTVPTRLTYMNGTYFDEIYFPRTAYEQIHGLSIYEKTHPPMGKVLQSIGILIFGMNPFGWRCVGTLFGVMLVPLMYFFALKIFKKRTYALSAGLLIMFDCMRLAQTRLATIDSYAAFFSMAMYYFMYDYFVQKSYELKPKKSLLPLFFCGIMFGLGAASKWVCVYSGAGLAFLFFLSKYTEGIDYVSGRKKRAEGEMSWFVKNLIPTCLACVLFFVIIPATIYILSYIPYMASNPDKTLIQIVVENQKYMFSYHSDLTATHAYGSPWWSWPIMKRPMWYSKGTDVAPGMTSTVVSIGNPLIWWVGIPCIIASFIIAWRKREKNMIVVFTAYVLQFAPWIIINRVCFIYHYFTCVPFMILMIVYVFKNLIEDGVIHRYTFIGYLALVFIMFALFYPALTSIPAPSSLINGLRWFTSWSF